MLREPAGLSAEARLTQILESTPDSIIIVDAEGKIVFANARTESLFEYPRAELLNQPVELLIPSRFHGGHAGLRRNYTHAPRVRPMGATTELFARRKDGTEFSVEISLSPVQTGDVPLVAAAIRDVSERKALEAKTRLLTERLMNAVESVSDAFALFDAADRLVLCNSACRATFFRPIRGPVEGLTFLEIFDANLQAGAFDLGTESVEHFRERRMRYRSRPAGAFDVRTVDGGSWRFTDRRTNEGGIVTTIWDITDDAHHVEELRDARTAAELANQAKSEFLSSMSHELRTPLNAVLGFAQLLRKDRKSPLTEVQQEWLQHVLKGGEHLLRLIDDVLDLARIEAGAVLLTPEPVAVERILREVTTTLAPMATRAGVELHVEPVPPGMPPVFGDRTRIVQILLNFGSNAIKYGSSGVRVDFSATSKMLSHGQRIIVTVSDHGVGIPLDKQDKLFSPFHRAGQETGPIEGTGIGLSISKKLAEMMDGAVGFVSAPGQGSRFWVELPAQLAHLEAAAGVETAAKQTPAPTTARQTSRTVLYVEDNPSNVALMEALLGTIENTSLITAPTAEIGIELARAYRPDIIILDINLPGMSGYDALEKLRELPELAEIPVVALSASATRGDLSRAQEAGFAVYLTKPVEIDKLTETLERLMLARAGSRSTPAE
ncbi:MAG: PAS domain S-box protein [Sandaracinaceae bacterium]|nr:PAS domain S-box protein [Sandaracinaceae bacterium]